MTLLASAYEATTFSSTPSDGVLVAETLAGRRAAFNELVTRYQSRAIAVASRLLGNIHDALDIAQEAFIKAFTRLPTLEQAEAFGAWLMRIVSNLSLNFRRSRRIRVLLPLDDHLPAPGRATIDQLENAELGARLDKALTQLPAKQQAVIAMFAIDQTPQKLVAGKLGCSVQAVKWHVFQGRRNLRKMLADCS
jgi:RNA polymerase sigma-70 factor (ECF subfamily)